MRNRLFHLYEKNKDKKELIEQIDFPSIQKRETARYIFEFINFLSHRTANNSVTGFSRLDEIKAHLSTQWSQLFQRLLYESRIRTREERTYRDFSKRIEDLKAIVLASLTTPGLRETAKGAIQFRHLIGFFSGIRGVDHRKLLLSDCDWEGLLKSAGISEFRPGEPEEQLNRNDSFVIMEDRTFYRCRYPQRIFEEFKGDWYKFTQLEGHSREAIVDALLEDREGRGIFALRYYNKDIDEYLSERRDALQQSEAEAALRTQTLHQELENSQTQLQSQFAMLAGLMKK